MQNDVFKVTVPAKVNLRLTITLQNREVFNPIKCKDFMGTPMQGPRDITPQSSGGLHTLDMIVCPYYALCDEVEFMPLEGEEISVDIKGAYSGFEPNRFMNFYLPKVERIASKLGVFGKLTVRKGIPLGAGLGGSTASVVGALKSMLLYLESIGQSTALDNDFLLSLGSDVPCMYKGGLCRVRGVGDVVDALDIKIDLDIAVRIAEGGSDTAACYALYDRLGLADKLQAIEDARDYGNMSADELLGLIAQCRNDLTVPAVTLNPKIGELIDEMKKEYDYVVMSGSGSSVIGFILPTKG